MWNYIWPIILVVTANTIYHITTKSTPSNVSPYLSLTVTYIVGAIFTFFLYRVSGPEKGIITDLRSLNWTSYALGLAIVGLEVGYIYLYRSGWNISTGSLVANILLAVALIGVGLVFFKEPIGLRQIAGIVLCVTGLVLVCK